MTDFMRSNDADTFLPGNKSDTPKPPGVPANQFGNAAQWNKLIGAVYSARSVVKSRYFDVELSFGADPTGVLDSYQAFVDLFAAVSAQGGGCHIRIPAGTYKIDKYKIGGGPSANGIGNFYLHDATNFTIDGYGAKLDIKGNFNRDADVPHGYSTWLPSHAYVIGNHVQNGSRDYVATGNGTSAGSGGPTGTGTGIVDGGGGLTWDFVPRTTSYETTVIPLYLQRCDHFSVAGLELDGNVDQMTRDGTVTEGSCFGIGTNACSHYTLSDLNVHHFAADGIAIGLDADPDSDVLLVNCKMWANARCGFAPFYFSDVTLLRCKITNGGCTNADGDASGTYGSHSPSCNIDIEPDNTVSRRITFLDCAIGGAVGSELATDSPHLVSDVTFLNCRFFTDDAVTTTSYSVICAVAGSLFENCTFDDIKSFNPSWNTSGHDALVRTVVRKCTFNVSDETENGILDATTEDVTIEDCQIIGKQAAPLAAIFPMINNSSCKFRRNTIFVPQAAFTGSGAMQAAQVNALESLGNRYETDLPDDASKHFYVSYVNTPRVVEDTFNEGHSNARTFRAYGQAYSKKVSFGPTVHGITVRPCYSNGVAAGVTITTNGGPGVYKPQMSGDVTMTATPTLQAGVLDGQEFVVWNTPYEGGGHSITFQDQGTLPSSGLRLSANTITLGPGDRIKFVYDASDSNSANWRWFQAEPVAHIL